MALKKGAQWKFADYGAAPIGAPRKKAVKKTTDPRYITVLHDPRHTKDGGFRTGAQIPSYELSFGLEMGAIEPGTILMNTRGNLKIVRDVRIRKIGNVFTERRVLVAITEDDLPEDTLQWLTNYRKQK